VPKDEIVLMHVENSMKRLSIIYISHIVMV